MIRKYKEIIAAGAILEVEHPGRYFSLLRAVSPVDVEFMRDYRVSDEAREVEAGLWCEPEGGFDRVRVKNLATYPVFVEFLLSRGRAGWSLPPPSCVTETTALAGLAASAVASTNVIDLGEDWASCVLGAQADLLVAGAGGSMSITCDDSPSMALQRLACGIGYSNVAYVVVSGTNHHISSIRPTGRYVRGNFTNGANPQTGPARFMLHVMRNVTA